MERGVRLSSADLTVIVTISHPNARPSAFVPLSMVTRSAGSGMWRLETPLPINKVQFGCHKVAYNLAVDLGARAAQLSCKGPQARPPVRGRLEWMGGRELIES